MIIPPNMTKIQYLERQKRKKNRRQWRGPLHPKGYTPIHHGLPVEPGWKPMPGYRPMDAGAGMIGALTALFGFIGIGRRRFRRPDKSPAPTKQRR